MLSSDSEFLKYLFKSSFISSPYSKIFSYSLSYESKAFTLIL